MERFHIDMCCMYLYTYHIDSYLVRDMWQLHKKKTANSKKIGKLIENKLQTYYTYGVCLVTALKGVLMDIEIIIDLIWKKYRFEYNR